MSYYNVQFMGARNPISGDVHVFEADSMQQAAEDAACCINAAAGEYAYIYPEGMDFAEAYERDLLHMVRG